MFEKKIEYPRELLNHTPATVRHAFDTANNPNAITETGKLGNINISNILSEIIIQTGRLADRYASDCIYDIENIRTLCEKIYHIEQPIDEILILAIRENGVDGTSFFMQQLYNSKPHAYPYVHVTPYYRRVLAVRIQVSETGNVKCELRNVTHSFNKFDPADLDEQGKLIQMPYAENPMPS